MSKVAEMLKQPNRNWSGNPPAVLDDILSLVSACRVKLPKEYLELLYFSNGGEGGLALPPRWFVLYGVNEALEIMSDASTQTDFSGFWFFGGNGGLEKIALDLRRGVPYPIVMVDPIAGLDSAVEMAPNMAQFIGAIGLEYADES